MAVTSRVTRRTPLLALLALQAVTEFWAEAWEVGVNDGQFLPSAVRPPGSVCCK
jgi:hypothetical protein